MAGIVSLGVAELGADYFDGLMDSFPESHRRSLIGPEKRSRYLHGGEAK